MNRQKIPVFDPKKGLEFGLYTLGDHTVNPHTGKRVDPQKRIQEMIEMAKLADQAGIDMIGIGESHQEYFVSQAHAVILGAIAQATKNIRISSSVSVLSTSDPVRVFEDFATLDLISNGRAEIVAGRASRVGLFDLLGYDINQYEELFEEKFELLLQINQEERVNWQGEFRAPLKDAQVLPRPLDGALPIWRAVGGSTTSAARAGRLGVPMYLAHLGGFVEMFKKFIDIYRAYAAESGYDIEQLPVATAGLFYAAKDSQTAMKEFYPHVNKGLELVNGRGFPKQAFVQSTDRRSILNVGSPEFIIEKILYQHEQFGNQRYIAQLDFGGVPFEKIMENIEMIGTTILPAIRKYTAKK